MAESDSKPPTYPHLPRKLILTSTKSYFSPLRTIEYLHALLDPAGGILPIKINPGDLLFALIPDFLTIYPCAHILESYANRQSDDFSSNDPGRSRGLFLKSPSPSSWPLTLGAQDCFWEPSYGAYTGEIVPEALSNLGIKIVEIGHAERRRMLFETDATTAKKAAAICQHGMVPLVCIGEIERPPHSGPMSMAVGNAMTQLKPQIKSLLNAVPADAPVIFAYEPVWAIGAKEPAGVDYVGPVVQAIREVIKAQNGRTGQTKVVYGGSAGPGLWSGKTNGGKGLGKWVDGMFLGRFAHQVSGVKDVMDEVIESIDAR